VLRLHHYVQENATKCVYKKVAIFPEKMATFSEKDREVFPPLSLCFLTPITGDFLFSFGA
jgi:hypothetical protein